MWKLSVCFVSLFIWGCFSALNLENCGEDNVLEISEQNSYLSGSYYYVYTDFDCLSSELSSSESFINLIFQNEAANTTTPIAWCRTLFRGFYSSRCSGSTYYLSNTVRISLRSYRTTGCSYRIEFTSGNEHSVVGNTLTCRHETEQAECKIDVVYRAEGIKCNLTYVTDTYPWTLSVQCGVTKTYSALDRYFCQLYTRNLNATNSTHEAVDSKVSMNHTSIGGQKYVSGSCQMNATLPSRDGSFNYTVHITPGNVTVSIPNTVVEIRRPSLGNLTHNCPRVISEDSQLSCTCSYHGNSSFPASTVKWMDANSNLLQLSSVKREQQGRNFTCQLMWNGEVVDRLTYVLDVTWTPSTSLKHTCPDFVTEGADLQCECVTDDVGNPPASLKWKDRTSADLTWNDITRDDNATPFTCELTRDGKILQTLTYVLRVRSSSAGLTSTQQLAIGLGVGLSVAAICVTVIVVFVLRRRRLEAPSVQNRGTPQRGLAPQLPSSRPPNPPRANTGTVQAEQGRRSLEQQKTPQPPSSRPPNTGSVLQAGPNYDSLQKGENLDNQYEVMQLNPKGSKEQRRSAPQDANRPSSSNVYGNMDSPDGDEENDPATYGNTA